MKTESHIIIVQGDDETVIIPVEDGDAGGFISDLSNFTVKYEVNERQGKGPTLLSYASGDSEVSITTAGNVDSTDLDDTGIADSDDVVRIDIPGTDTSMLDDPPYWHECEIETGGGKDHTVMQGRVEAQDSTT